MTQWFHCRYILTEIHTDSKENMHSDLHCSIVGNSQAVEATHMPIDRWVEYRVEYYSAIKKNEILPFTTSWIDVEGAFSQKKTNMIWFHLHVDSNKQ